MKPDKHIAGAAGIILAAACLIALTWLGTMRAISDQRLENAARVSATLANQALTFTELINRQLLALDQTLRISVAAWEANPGAFDLEAWRRQAIVLSGISRDMMLTDENGIVRQSSVVEAINADVSGLDFFHDLSEGSGPADRMFVGPATIGAIMRQWHMNVARALHRSDGSFAGAIDADYRISAITDVFRQTDLGPGAFITLVGVNDGKMRGAIGPATIDTDVGIGETRMFAAIQRAESGIWTGPSATDPVWRIHAYRRIPGRDLVVVVAMSEAEAMHPATVWRRQAEIFAGCITALLAGLAALLISGGRTARRRDIAVREDRAVLAAANAQLEVAKALATAKAEHLQATLTGMSDGVSMFDAHLCLVEWNARFPEIAGVPKEMLHVGLPMEEILRAQVRSGQFGRITDPEGEVEKRIARIRKAPYGITQRQRPDGRTLELRRNKLPDGGFVTLYSDISAHKQAEESLHRARAEAEAASAAKSRFVAIVSHEIRNPLDALLNTIRLLADGTLAPAQQSLLAAARHSGDVLFGLINDILEMSQMEAGKLVVRPSLFDLRELLDSAVEVFAPQARERAIILHVIVAEHTPRTLLTDPGRLRQVLFNLISNALKYARPGDVWVTAEPGPDETRAAMVTVKDSGPVIPRDAREQLFRPFSRLDRPEGMDLSGTGLGLTICQHLMTLMGGEIGCDAWTTTGEPAGNSFWITLPAEALPFRDDSGNAIQTDVLEAIGMVEPRLVEPEPQPPAPADDVPDTVMREIPRRPVPRTRVLLTDDVLANQLVTATLLRREGHMVDIAGSGAEALQAVQSAAYDLIFMDIFMPGMSGQEAARAIRALPEPACSIPIIALTANAAAADTDVFRSAGMNGLLSKPISLAALLDVLRVHVWSAPPKPPRSLSANRGAQQRDNDALDGSLSLKRISELKLNLPPEIFDTLIQEGIADLTHRLPALRRAITARNAAAITTHAHAMVGVAAGYGMAALEYRLRGIMSVARDGDVTALDGTTAADVEADLNEAIVKLRKLMQAETA